MEIPWSLRGAPKQWLCSPQRNSPASWGKIDRKRNKTHMFHVCSLQHVATTSFAVTGNSYNWALCSPCLAGAESLPGAISKFLSTGCFDVVFWNVQLSYRKPFFLFFIWVVGGWEPYKQVYVTWECNMEWWTKGIFSPHAKEAVFF